MTIDRPDTDPFMSDAICSTDSDGFRIELIGEIDLSTRPQLDDILARVVAAPPAPVLVDLTDVTFLSSIGLGFLSQLRRHAIGGGHKVTLRRPGPIARRALQVIGFDQLFPITDVDNPGDREGRSEVR